MFFQMTIGHAKYKVKKSTEIKTIYYEIKTKTSQSRFSEVANWA